MNKRRMLMLVFLVIGVPLFIWIQFVEMPSKVKIGEEKMQQDPMTHNFESVTKYNSEYMGDASNLNNLLSNLPLNNYKDSIELDSDELSLLVDYKIPKRELKEKAQQTVLYNSTALFALIDNLEEVEIKFQDSMYAISRDRVEKWYGTTLNDFKEPEIFQKKVQKELANDSTEWFKAYTESE